MAHLMDGALMDEVEGAWGLPVDGAVVSSCCFDHALTLQQFDHLGQAILQAFLRFFYFYFSHRRTPLPAAEHAGEINQLIHDC